MSVMFAVVVAAIATSLTWSNLSRRHRHVWTVFVAYVSLLPVFATIYHHLYLQNPLNFVFASPVADTREKEIDAAMQVEIDRVRKKEAHIRHLLSVIEIVPLLDPNAKPPLRMNIADGQSIAIVAHVPPTGSDVGKQMVHVIATEAEAPAGTAALIRGYRHMGSPPLDHIIMLSIVGDTISNDDQARTAHTEPMLPTDVALLKTEVLAWLSRTAAERAPLEQRKAIPRAMRRDAWGLIDFLYFSVITQATIGYGDIFPNSRLARIVVMAQVVMSVALLTIVLAYAATFIQGGGAA